jgi:hypothetical protein
MLTRPRAAVVGVALASIVTTGVALAYEGSRSVDGVIDNAESTHHHHTVDHQHGDVGGHLDPVHTDNIRLVSALELRNVEPGKIADVGVHNGYAYLAAWGGETCKYNGVHVVDIRNPEAPKEVAFVNSKEGSAPGEGVQALSISTKQFTGDILVTNNEKCNDKTGFGGLNIYNITNPAHPTVLTEGYGDQTVNGQGKKAANDIHSVFAWDAGDKAYAVIVDNEETADVDIVDISNPKKPKLIREIDLANEFPQIGQMAPSNLTQVFHHDMIVKQIAGRQIMLISYWDGGYVKLDVTDPVNPTYVADSDFALIDDEVDGVAPEGNAHQAEFTRDNRYILAADEDFTPFNSEAFTNDDATPFLAVPGDLTTPLANGETLTGPTTMVGRACIGDEIVPAGGAGVDDIAVVTRGLCTFTEKVANVEAAGGWEAVLVVNREGGDGCGAFGMAVEGGIPAFSVSREVGYGLFDVAGYDNGACLAGSASLIPGVAVGAAGDTVTVRSFFDGWGYVRLFSNNDGKLDQLDTYAIPEAVDPDKGSGYGDLSVHEIATSHAQDNLAYVSYYSGGLRIVEIQGDEIVEVGAYIAGQHAHSDGDHHLETGNNFWGVQVFEHDGKEYVAASDRDHGVFIFEYTPVNNTP